MKTCFEYHHHQDHLACVILVDIRTVGGFKLPHPDSAASIRVSQLLYTTSERSKRDPTDRIVIVSFIICSDSDLVLDVNSISQHQHTAGWNIRAKMLGYLLNEGSK